MLNVMSFIFVVTDNQAAPAFLCWPLANVIFFVIVALLQNGFLNICHTSHRIWSQLGIFRCTPEIKPVY